MRAFTEADRRAMSDPVFAARYRAASAHDVRSDGYFVVGNPMSESFCRPGCAIRTPRPSRVTFHRTAAAAHAAGLAPCPRCRPDAACASPDLTGGDSVAARALRLIADGEMDHGGVGHVADMLGLTSRHVLRAVRTQTGCGPLAVARTQRAHLARLLLVSTSLPLTEVAQAAGFGTERQFAATVSRFYHLTPGALRAGSRHHTARGRRRPGPVTVRCMLAVRTPYDTGGMFAALARLTVPGTEQIGAHAYTRAVRLPHGAGSLRVEEDDRLRLWAVVDVADSRDVGTALHRIRCLFDLDADPARIDGTLRRDRALASAAAAHPGVRNPGTVDAAETLLCTMIGRHLTADATRTTLGRLARALGEPTRWGLLFPTPDRIAQDGRRLLGGAPDHADAVVGAAAALASGRLVLHRGLTHAALVDALTALPGVGGLTAQQVAVRVLGSADVLPADDPDIRRGAAAAGLPSSARELSAHGRQWAPWRSYAAEGLRRLGTA